MVALDLEISKLELNKAVSFYFWDFIENKSATICHICYGGRQLLRHSYGGDPPDERILLYGAKNS